MRSRRSFLQLGFVAAATLAASSASALPAYHGSARGGGTVTARDDMARTFSTVRRGSRAWTYQVTDNTRFVVGGAPGSWWDVRVGAVVQVRWHRAGNQRVADVVGIRAPSGH